MRRITIPEEMCRFLQDRENEIQQIHLAEDLNHLDIEAIKNLLLYIAQQLYTETHDLIWFHIQRENNEYLIAKKETEYIVLEKYQLDKMYVCIKNTIKRDAYTDDEWFEFIRMHDNMEMGVNGPKDINAAFAYVQTLDLAETDDMFTTLDEGEARLWIEFQKEYVNS